MSEPTGGTEQTSASSTRLSSSPAVEASLLAILSPLVSEGSVLAMLLAELAPYAPALLRMAKEMREQVVAALLREDWLSAKKLIAAKLTDAEMLNMAKDNFAKVAAFSAKAAEDDKLIKEVLLRLAVGLLAAGIGAL